MSTIGADNVHITNSESSEINLLEDAKLLKRLCSTIVASRQGSNNRRFSEETRKKHETILKNNIRQFHSNYEAFLVSKTKYNLPVFKYYDRTRPIGDHKYLQYKSNAELEFKCQVDNACSYLSEQFVFFETHKPEYDATAHPGIDTERIRYRYAALPGLRLFENVTMRLCDDPLFDEYNIDQARFFNVQCISERAREKWNECLGHDNEVEGKAELRDFEVDWIQKFRIGNQTYKADQPGLKLMIPLLFQHSTALGNALQIDSLQSKGLGFRIKLAPLGNIVKSVLIGDEPTDPDVDLKLKPLQIKNIVLYSRFYNFDDAVYNALIETASLKMYKTSRVEYSNRLKVNKDILQLKFTRYACEFLNFAIVKMNNCNDFDHWYKFGYYDEIPKALAIPAVRLIAGVPTLYSAGINLHNRRNVIDKFAISNATTRQNTNTTHREEHYDIVSTYDQFKYCQEQGTRYYASNKYDNDYGTYAFAAKPGLTNALTGLFSFTINREFKLEYKLIEDFDECKLYDEHLRFIFYYKCVNFVQSNRGHMGRRYDL